MERFADQTMVRQVGDEALQEAGTDGRIIVHAHKSNLAKANTTV